MPRSNLLTSAGNRLFLLLLLVCCSAIASTTVYKTDVNPADWVGSIHMTGTGDWAPLGTTLIYSVALELHESDGTPIYKYDYSFVEYGNDPADGLNRMLLEFSVSCNTDPGCFRDDPHQYQAGDIPHLPAGFNAAEWDADNTDNRSRYGFHFLSNRLPVWGNFFAEGAGDNAWSYNAGLLDLEGTVAKGFFVPRPDGDPKPVSPADAPEPAAWWLTSIGVALLVVFRRRKGEA